jgi:hypothetical protein
MAGFWFIFGLDIPAMNLQIFVRHFWLVTFKSSLIFSSSLPVGQLKNFTSFSCNQQLIQAASCLCPAPYIRFGARLAGRCPAPAAVTLLGFCSGLDKHRSAFFCYLQLSIKPSIGSGAGR